MPCDSFEIELGEWRQSRATSFNLVSSPSAAKSGACLRHWRAPAKVLRRERDMFFDVFELLGPAVLVHVESFVTPMSGDFRET